MMYYDLDDQSHQGVLVHVDPLVVFLGRTFGNRFFGFPQTLWFSNGWLVKAFSRGRRPSLQNRYNAVISGG